MRRKFVAGNWKMHGSLAENQTRLTQLKSGLKSSDVDLAVFPTSPYLSQCQSVLASSNISWGAQTLSEFTQGAYTGEISAQMLKDFGCEYVIIGHSERRELFAETDKQIALKYVAAQQAGLTPILCVGETLDQREAGITEAVISAQIQVVLDEAGITSFANAVIAYEPIWAIGTGKTATPEQAQQVHAAIRAQLAALNSDIAQGVQVLYGGSVKPANAKAIFAQADVDGALVGGAALNAEDFIQICNSAG